MTETDDRDTGPRTLLRAGIELAVVGGASLLAIFWVIPSQTTPGENFGLSPTMVPIVCATAIGLLALLQFAAGILRRAAPQPGGGGFAVAGAVALAAIIGVAVIGAAGLIWGGPLIAGLVSLGIGERRPVVLGAIVGGAAAIILFVEWSGI